MSASFNKFMKTTKFQIMTAVFGATIDTRRQLDGVFGPEGCIYHIPIHKESRKFLLFVWKD